MQITLEFAEERKRKLQKLLKLAYSKLTKLKDDRHVGKEARCKSEALVWYLEELHSTNEKEERNFRETGMNRSQSCSFDPGGRRVRKIQSDDLHRR